MNNPEAPRPTHPAPANPLLPGIGLTDPHVRLFRDRVFLYASHDFGPSKDGHRMDDWWIWSSDDLFHWRLEGFVRPEETYLRGPLRSCWAVDAEERNGNYFFYFSAGPEETGVLVGESPAGPWRDPIGKPIIAHADIGVSARDPSVFTDDDGSAWLVVGCWDFFLAKLNDDMVSLAAPPVKLEILDPEGPYGKGKTDDKPCLHKRDGIYYLSWGAYYATSDSLAGPYQCRGAFLSPETAQPGFHHVEFFFDRHGSFFSWRGQDYFICNDFSRPGGSTFFRDSILCRVHYRSDGELAPLEIRGIGVGQYDASAGPIAAADFYELHDGRKAESVAGFVVEDLRNGSWVGFRRVHGIRRGARITVRGGLTYPGDGRIEVRRDEPGGALLATMELGRQNSGEFVIETTLSGDLPERSPVDLCLVVRGSEEPSVWIREFQFENSPAVCG